MESALLNGRIISKVSRLGRTLESIQANPLWSSNHFYGLSDVCSSHTSHDGEFTFSWDQESLSSHWIDIFYRKYRVTQLVEWQTKGQIQISRFRIKCFFCHIVMSWGPSTDLNSQKEDESLSWPVPQENRKDCWDWLHDKERQLICEKRVFLSGSKKKKISIWVLVETTVVPFTWGFAFHSFSYLLSTVIQKYEMENSRSK